MTEYENAATEVGRALYPVMEAAEKAIERINAVTAAAPIDGFGPGSISAIPPMVAEKTKTAKKAVAACLDEIIEAANDKIAAALAEASPQKKLEFGASS